MTKAFLNRETNLVDTPIHPCYKALGRGFCRLRTDDELKFACCREPGNCRYLKDKVKGKTE